MSFSKAKMRLFTPTLLIAALIFATTSVSLGIAAGVQALEESTEETQTSILQSADLAPDMMARGDTISVVITADQFSTKGSSNFEIYIHSTPLHLGTFMSDEAGNLSFSVQLPAGIAPGYHTLHIYGPDTAGNQLDIRDIVFVVASIDDYDGDGIPNDQDTCTILPQSEPEFDEDSVDPVCGSQNGTPTNNTPSQSGTSKLPTSQVLGSGFTNPLLNMYKKSLKNVGLAQGSATNGSAVPDTQAPGPDGDAMGTAKDDVVVVKKAAEEPPKQTYEMSLIVGLTAVVFLLAAGVAAAKWYAKRSN